MSWRTVFFAGTYSIPLDGIRKESKQTQPAEIGENSAFEFG